jgi:hypothetical protein
MFILFAKGWTTYMPSKEADILELGMKNFVPMVFVIVMHWLISIMMFFD